MRIGFIKKLEAFVSLLGYSSTKLVILYSKRMFGPKQVCDAKAFDLNGHCKIKWPENIICWKNVKLWWCLCCFEMSSQFFTLFVRGHVNSWWDGGEWFVSHILLCLHMLFGSLYYTETSHTCFIPSEINLVF